MLMAAAVAVVMCLLVSGSAMAATPGCVDVETASAKQLTTLAGVGPALSKAIINHRKAERNKATRAGKKKWNFRNWATLMKVKGVGPAICKKNIAKVCFGGKVQKACPR